jgi:transposase, IS30 family
MSNNLTNHERQMLQYWLRTKKSLRDIAKVMRRTHSVLSKEINKNGCGDRKKYRADTAQKKCEKRKHEKHKGKLDKYPELKKYVEERLLEDLSPEQIAGELKEYPPPELKNLSISHESIYYWVYEKSEKYKQLYKHLRTHRKKRCGHGKRKAHKTSIPERVSIHDRPGAVAEKVRFGDWESDTVEFSKGKQNPYLSVQYERKSQLVRIHKLKNKSAEETKEAVIKTAESVPREMFKTITFDNGTEGVKHVDLREMYDIQTYFCDPLSSWQKGGVENMNKLIRQYLPRTTNMHEITDEDIQIIQERLNNRPRKGLNYLSPNEFIQKSGSKLT